MASSSSSQTSSLILPAPGCPASSPLATLSRAEVSVKIKVKIEVEVTIKVEVDVEVRVKMMVRVKIQVRVKVKVKDMIVLNKLFLVNLTSPSAELIVLFKDCHLPSVRHSSKNCLPSAFIRGTLHKDNFWKRPSRFYHAISFCFKENVPCSTV